MIHFHDITAETFLKEYWQKKPLVLRNALPGFTNPISADELAGLALEDEMESRIVIETPGQTPQWRLKRGAFTEADFAQLPETHWTLLVQGVDRVVPECAQLLDHFDFIPQWRLDDLMISYAALHGSVGPHYDNYDVFLFQASGRRIWSLTSRKCTPENYLSDTELRIMAEFDTEMEFVLEEGDMLYLPPHIGHYGIAASEHCMTFSFGYRSYQGQEVWDSLGDYLAEKNAFNTLYRDPDWSEVVNTAEMTDPAWQQAKQQIQNLLNDDATIKDWFGCFATRLDQQAEQQLPMPLEDEALCGVETFVETVQEGRDLLRDPCCRFVYYYDSNNAIRLYINGCAWDTQDISPVLCELVANQRFLPYAQLKPHLQQKGNQQFLYELWKLQWLQL